MKTGDTFKDADKRTWTVGQGLGRGLWGATWVARTEGGPDAVVKVPYAAEDLPADAPVPKELLQACEACAREQAELLQAAAVPFLSRLEGLVDVGGRPALLLPRYPGSLQAQLATGMPLGAVLALAERVSRLLVELSAAGRVHGNLRPSNVLVNERGDPVLTDVLTPAAHAWWRRLQGLSPDRRTYAAPEADGPPITGWDAWALCQVVWEAAMIPSDGGDHRPPAPPHDGLDKVRLATLRDRALARLKSEGANPRFVNRVAERLGSLLNRGLSREIEPSPPYRFANPGELRPRLSEVAALVHPAIDTVGKVLLSAEARDDVFEGGVEVRFSVTVGATDGVTDHEHVACGVQVIDLDGDDDARVQVPDTRYTVQAHPSGRLRFQFTLPDLPPGRYRAKAAFAIRDSGGEPKVAEGDFEVRPPPGWVPPVDPVDDTPAPLSLDAHRPKADAPDPVAVDAASTPDADVYPTPIAPSSAGVGAVATAGRSQAERIAVDVEHVPTVAEMPSMDAPAPRIEIRPPRAGAPPVPSNGAGHPAVAADGDTPKAPPQLQVKPGAAGHGATPVSPGPRAWSGPGEWEDELPGPDDDLADDAEPWVPGPGGGDDLPEWDDRRQAGGGFDPAALVQRVLEIGRRDAWAVVLVILACVLGVLVVALTIARLILI